MLVGISEAICLLLVKLIIYVVTSLAAEPKHFFVYVNYLFNIYLTYIVNFMKIQINKIITLPLLSFFKINLRSMSTLPNCKSFNSDIIFNQWLAGLIDGDGCFLLSKKVMPV
jgi:hypothetical protein